MDKPELKPCPFCGDKPVFSAVEERDERRFMSMTLECCASMEESIGWGAYKSMTPAEIQTALETELTKRWNFRA